MAFGPTVYVVPLTGTGATLVIVRTTRYPEGAGDAAVKLPLIWLVEAAVNVNVVGCAVGATHGRGGVHVQVRPDAGIFVELRFVTADIVVPATEVAQVFVPLVTDLRLKSAAEFPTSPIP